MNIIMRENIVITNFSPSNVYSSSNSIHSPLKKEQEKTCEDSGSWCSVMADYCEHYQVQEKCPKTCNQCGKYKVIHYFDHFIAIDRLSKNV